MLHAKFIEVAESLAREVTDLRSLRLPSSSR